MSQGDKKTVWDMVLAGVISNTTFERTKQSLDRDRYTVKQAADVIGCHEKTARKWIKQDKLKAYRPTERKTYITREQLAAFLLRREEES